MRAPSPITDCANLPFKTSVHTLFAWISCLSDIATIRGDGVLIGEVEDVHFGGGFADCWNPRSRHYYICSIPL